MRESVQKRASDDGFSLIEVIVAIMILTAVTVPFAMVLYSSLGHLRTSETRADGVEIASQQLELIRAMDYSDVGIVAGSVPGSLSASTTSVQRGQNVTVDLTVAYVDDPVPGSFESGADYKLVTVTVSFPDADLTPVVQETLVAPSGTSGKSTYGIVSVTVNEIGSSNSDSSILVPAQIYMIGGPDSAPVEVFSAGEESKDFVGLTPNPNTDPSDPDYEYELRLGPSDGDRSGTYLGQVWWMNPADYASAARVRVLELNSVVTTLRIFRAATLNLELKTSVQNLALAATATQSSTDTSGEAFRAIDGSNYGAFANGSVSSTTNEHQPYFDLDLGSEQDIDFVRIWNRTDCCGAQLQDVHVFVSSYPFASSDPNTTRADPNVTTDDFGGSIGLTADFAFDISGRYIRVQLNNTDNLNLAEVEVFSEADSLVDFDADLSFSLRVAASCSLGATICPAEESNAVSLSGGAASVNMFDGYGADPGSSYGLMPGNWIVKISHVDRHLSCDDACTDAGGVTVVPIDGTCSYVEVPISLDPIEVLELELGLGWTGLDISVSPQVTTGLAEC